MYKCYSFTPIILDFYACYSDGNLLAKLHSYNVESPSLGFRVHHDSMVGHRTRKGGWWLRCVWFAVRNRLVAHGVVWYMPWDQFVHY